MMINAHAGSSYEQIRDIYLRQPTVETDAPGIIEDDLAAAWARYEALKRAVTELEKMAGDERRADSVSRIAPQLAYYRSARDAMLCRVGALLQCLALLRDRKTKTQLSLVNKEETDA